MKKRIRAAICVLIAFILLVGSAYVNTYYRASETTTDAVKNAEELNNDVLVFKPEDEIKAGLIFYPGGKVEYTAYAPLMEACAEEGILCILMKMPCNLAVLNVNAADGMKEHFWDVKEWYMGGHSLGGSMAASYIGKNAEDFKGLILLASYSTEELSDKGLDVLSIYGTADRVLNKEKYMEYEGNLPVDYREVVIDGGCHAYFGDYGEQEGDGDAKISREEQQLITVGKIKEFVKQK